MQLENRKSGSVSADTLSSLTETSRATAASCYRLRRSASNGEQHTPTEARAFMFHYQRSFLQQRDLPAE